jgi:hypothetical protein
VVVAVAVTVLETTKPAVEPAVEPAAAVLALDGKITSPLLRVKHILL